MNNKLSWWKNPPSPYTSLKNTMVTSFDDIFDEVFNNTFPELSKEFGLHFLSKASYPKIDITEDPTNVTIEAEIGGLQKEDVNISVTGDQLVIRGNKQNSDKPVETKTYIRREIKRSSFERAFQINPEILDSTKISAKFENGSLFITLPKIKKPEVKPLTTQIKIN